MAAVAFAVVGYFGPTLFAGRGGPTPIPPLSSASAPSPESAFSILDRPREVPAVHFEDAEGRSLSLADFRGKVVLLNLWATWCGPCRREMPTLDRLQARLGGPEFEVLALSIDRAGIDVVRNFYREVGVERLAMYIDASGKAARALGALGLPTTLLIDQEGREIGRLIGPAEWDAAEMVAFLRRYLASKSGAVSPGAGTRSTRHPADRRVAARAPRGAARPKGLALPVTRLTTSPASNGGAS
ncbi:MAG: TlpA family protein disulfide reductase [Proteobacteria bacterium]|nr:TlpA family protein disulfide reductase [Pseudomonadota bacterium]